MAPATVQAWLATVAEYSPAALPVVAEGKPMT